jgi:galactonate dehydratase
MRITAIETVHVAEFPSILWVRVHTDKGLIGLGETFFAPESVAAHVHSHCAPLLLGEDALAIERHWRTLARGTGGAGLRSIELRAASAIDIALWDLFGQSTGLPIYRLLGGPTRERIRIYNTCAGYRYGRMRPRGAPATYTDGKVEGPYEDLDAFLHRADELALSLLEQGITAMKIWPFDQFGPSNGGLSITLEEIKQGLEPFEKVRKAVGDRMEIALEMHSVWHLPAAIQIAAAVEPYRPMWYEDPVRMDNMDALVQFKQSTRVPVTASETLSTRWPFREMLEKRAVSIVMLDVGWVGGITEAKKIAAMAEAYSLPVAPHDCVGPVVLMASAHLDFGVTNAMIQETVRAYLHGWYPQLVTTLPRIEQGYLYPPEGPGLGTALQPDVLRRPDAAVRLTRAE